MALNQAASLGTGLAVSALVVAIHMNATPSLADVRVGDVGNADIDSAERAASWQAAGVVAVVSLLARDPTIFIIGGAVTVGMALWTRHANWTNPLTGRASTATLGRDATMMDVEDEAA